ncbi:MFS general substrate transporter [Roridomyces roridus]|uniref:MFS general substrate transporter n=1 Tax=Roridomyces roridus TaxID=1738132 RepID=A0AAD7BYU2_9AGAR|nr:MFS general substrate transporter [Roridomyces roridus]
MATSPAQHEAETPGNAGPNIQLTDQTNLLPFRRLLPTFLGLGLCIVVSTLDSVIVSTALPKISAAFKAGSVISWVPSAYLLTSTCFLPLYGRFSDIFGRKNALCLAMALFMIGNLIAGFSKTILQLIVFRGFAGAGGGGIMSMVQIVVSDLVSLRERGKYQGIIGGVVAVGYAIGPVIGGALSQNVGWHWCVWVTIPVSFVATCVVVFLLPLKPVQGEIRSKLLAVDYLGALLTLGGCASLMLPLVWGGAIFPWKSSIVLGPFISSFAVFALFCLWEWRGARLPIVPMYIFKHSTVSGVFVAMFVNGFVFFSTLYYLPQFFQLSLGYDPLQAAVFLVPLLVTLIIINWAAGMLVSFTGHYRTIVYVGFGVWSIACGCVSTIRPGTSKGVLVAYMMLAGIGGGQTMQTTMVAVQASVARRDMSVVTAMRNFLRLLGGTLSLAVASTLINNNLRTAMDNLSISPSLIKQIIDDPTILHNPTSVGLSSTDGTDILYHGYTKGFSSLFIMNAALTAFATCVSVVFIKHKELSRGDEEALRQKAIREEVERKMKKQQKPGKSGAATPVGVSESGIAAAREEEGLEMAELGKKGVEDV